MSFLTGIMQLGTMLNATRDIVEAIKPRPQPAAVQSSPEEVRQRFMAELAKANARFVELRDLDGNGMLDPIEFEVDKTAFAQMDLDKDGFVSTQELTQAYLRNQQQQTGTNWMTQV
ncbi:MAG: EF-hand protein [Candidatus Hydrogenedentes bacterium]|nr:EF-hand protein [Candidatus Hydrogenedentota bacterium]